MKSLEIFAVLLSAQKVLGEFINPCSNTTKVTPLKDFDMKKFSEMEWYNIDVIDLHPPPDRKEPICLSQKFSATSDPYEYEVNFSYKLNRSEPIKTFTTKQTVDHDYPGVGVAHYGRNVTVYLIILETDYKTWATFYGCSTMGGGNWIQPYATISSSARTLEKKIHDKLASDIEKLGFAKKDFYPAIQTDC